MSDNTGSGAGAAPASNQTTFDEALGAQRVLKLLLKAGKAITSEVELEKLVQRITDVATELTGAQFGAFFYNVENQAGESYQLYTISGVPREAFSKFPMPRNTKIFEPTFNGQGVVRHADVTKAAGYGENPPYRGMPHGHLPVRSYLSAPVINPLTKVVIGGLFFAHPEIGVFDAHSETLFEGIAAQAAIAMGNAHLFEEMKRTEATPRDQREQYRSIFHSTTDAMIFLDAAGKVVDANPAASRLLGYATDQWPGLHGSQLMDGSDDRYSTITSIARSGRRYNATGVLRRSDGQPVHVEITATQFVHRSEPHILLALNDVTSNVHTREALERSEAFAQIITNASPVTLWMTNERAETIYINLTWLDWVGGNYNDHLGTGWLNAILPEDRELAAQKFMLAFNEQRVFTHDFRIRRRDGSVQWCATQGSPYYSADGSLGGFAGSLTDITERKQAEEKLASQNVLINTIADNTMQALFMMNDRQVCTYMNSAAERMTGFKLHEVLEKPLHYYVHHTHPDGRHFPIEECPIDRALPTKMQTHGETVFVHRDGNFYPVAFTASPIIENGVPKGTVIEAHDVTEEKRIQAELRDKETLAKRVLEQTVRERTAELEKTNYELLQFTSVASHDLKEPVRKISVFGGRLKAISGDVADPSFQRYLDNILASANRMSSLIDDLLAFSRLSQTDVPLQPVDLNELLSIILGELELAILEKNASVRVQSLPVVCGMPLQLGQVFQNLISNSLKFAHSERSPVIEISCNEAIVSDAPHYHIVYRDNGIGFENEFADKIFELFQRLHTRDQYQGTGIGLSIVKKIINLHGGRIIASGAVNHGAQFDIYLPKQP